MDSHLFLSNHHVSSGSDEDSSSSSDDEEQAQPTQLKPKRQTEPEPEPEEELEKIAMPTGPIKKVKNKDKKVQRESTVHTTTRSVSSTSFFKSGSPLPRFWPIIIPAFLLVGFRTKS